MRYRALDATGDYQLGVPFLVDSPQCVAQAVLTRLRLWLGEWFIDTSDGTPWLTEILGPRAGRNPDAAIQQRILGTPGVKSITAYSSNFNGNTRALAVQAEVATIYGPVTFSEVLP